MNVMLEFKTYFSNLRIKNKMLFAFLPLIIIPIVIIGFSSYFIYQDNVVKNTIQDRMNSSYLIKQRIDNIFENTEGCANMITFDLNNIVGKIKEDNTVEVSDVERKYLIENKLNFSLLIFKDVAQAIFVDNKQRVYTANDKVISNSSSEQIIAYTHQLEETSGYSRWFNMTRFTFDNTEETSTILPVGRKVVEINTGETLGYLLLFVNENSISSLFKQVKELKTSDFFLVDDNNIIISSTRQDRIFKTFENPNINQWIGNKVAEGNVKLVNRTKIIYTKVPVNQGKWLIVYQVNLEELTQDYKLLQNIHIILMLFSAAFTVIVALKLSKMIVEPIQRLIKTMDGIEGNQYNEPLYVNSKDEVGELTYTYNKMIERISQLIKEVEEEQKTKRKYELSLLQQQIKPHFLYNTLDVVYTLADLGRIKEAKKSVKALADFYRISLSSGKEIITIKEEVDMIRSYLYIQHLRYKDVFDYQINFTRDIMQYSILKLTIQPLVENAIYHGLKNKTTIGCLEINGFIRDDILCIEVKDDGLGMSKECLEKVLNESNNDNHKFGLYSINHRIKLFFGEQYGLCIESKENQETTVTIRIPLIKLGGSRLA